MTTMYFSELLLRAAAGENRFSDYTIMPTPIDPKSSDDESPDIKATERFWNPFVRKALSSVYARELLDRAEEYVRDQRAGKPDAQERFLAYLKQKRLTNGTPQAAAMKDAYDGLDALHLLDCELDPALYIFTALLPDLEVHEVKNRISGTKAKMAGVVAPYAQFREVKIGGAWTNVVAVGSTFEDVGMQDLRADGSVFVGARLSGDGSGAKFVNCDFSYADLSGLDVSRKARPRGRDETGVTVFKDCKFEDTKVSSGFDNAHVIDTDRPVPLKLLASQGKVIVNGGGR